MKKSLLS